MKTVARRWIDTSTESHSQTNLHANNGSMPTPNAISTSSRPLPLNKMQTSSSLTGVLLISMGVRREPFMPYFLLTTLILHNPYQLLFIPPHSLISSPPNAPNQPPLLDRSMHPPNATLILPPLKRNTHAFKSSYSYQPNEISRASSTATTSHRPHNNYDSYSV